MILKKGKEKIELTDAIQIAAYKKSGYTEVKQAKKSEGEAEQPPESPEKETE